MKPNFIALILACSACVTVSEAAMASDRLFGDMQNHFVPSGYVKDNIGAWENGQILYLGLKNKFIGYIQDNYDFIEKAKEYNPGTDKVLREWYVFQNPETKAYIAIDTIGSILSVRKTGAAK